MASALEEKARSLDDESISIAASTRQIAEQIGGKVGTLEGYIRAKRRGLKNYNKYKVDNLKKRGFNNECQYLDSLAQKAGAKNRYEFQAKNKGHNSWRNYREALVKEKSFLDINDYQNYLRKRKEGETPLKYFQRLEDEAFFENDLELATTEQIDKLETADRDYFTQAKLDGRTAIASIKFLDDREKQVIYQRYLAENPPTLKEIGESMSLGRERIRQIESLALLKMKRYIQIILYTHQNE